MKYMKDYRVEKGEESIRHLSIIPENYSAALKIHNALAKAGYVVFFKDKEGKILHGPPAEGQGCFLKFLPTNDRQINKIIDIVGQLENPQKAAVAAVQRKF